MAGLPAESAGAMLPAVDRTVAAWEFLPSVSIVAVRGIVLVQLDLAIMSVGRTDESRPAAKSRVENWFLAHAAELGHFLRRYIHTQQDVDDCVQETFLRVWRQEQQGTLKEEARGYLFTTALNVARDRYRRNQVRCANAHDVLNDELIDHKGPGAESTVHWRQGMARLETALAGLRPSTRTVFLLHHVERLTYAQIARKQGVTTRTVEREMARALSHCAVQLQQFLAEEP
jgi:RNA polymerase sigma factor (sigma-70 family)